ncbi:MAG: sulfur carrier protein ThiS [Planctomycetales bacterium]|nr:sulfur carrier protein ThiS [Planctomycetales bacterium]NIM09528.1 sulfur carrier protein ThiS [Planctomycetales bacterium]NIN09016.1 sulfur carrier protein ThiS [Planctomycetales bacterium]NIN78131.1 sulfur carrier protein ThiS [Planctomycetales bacterium]NIO35311.1 sulfur carrier protein ThiS [Planctomycetales bacterium]
MEIFVNGQARQVPAGMTVAELLKLLRIETRHVAVEVNLELVPRTQHPQHKLVDHDQLEIVTLVGGG